MSIPNTKENMTPTKRSREEDDLQGVNTDSNGGTKRVREHDPVHESKNEILLAIGDLSSKMVPPPLH